ncbi:hypothetical protein CPB83DRAFT_449975 [Crepidotus variabilis]|uniref:Uncharacterized protein n=1 Tax=Crepidotus variabilis TaxID=179855 RepID=A0A9P6EC56_9AGAR|nr:hypothetical protein CPB83DRAFT_449975 [Crepidotus variabilis]
MSFSVDDLVSSFSSSHIGQEALDLATLQAQLAATLFCAPGSSSSSASSTAAAKYTCPSPMRTPSTSFRPLPSLQSIDTAMSGMNGMAGMTTPIASRRGSCSVSSPYPYQQQFAQPQQHSYYTSSSSSAFEDAMEEDERMMVEELLIPSSPVLSSSTSASSFSSVSNITPSSFFNTNPTPAAHPQFSHSHSQSQSQASSHYHSLDHTSQTSSSLFTSTDPFYLAQLQASQQPPTSSSQSVFAQNGRMAQSSRFALSAF